VISASFSRIRFEPAYAHATPTIVKDLLAGNKKRLLFSFPEVSARRLYRRKTVYIKGSWQWLVSNYMLKQFSFNTGPPDISCPLLRHVEMATINRPWTDANRAFSSRCPPQNCVLCRNASCPEINVIQVYSYYFICFSLIDVIKNRCPDLNIGIMRRITRLKPINRLCLKTFIVITAVLIGVYRVKDAVSTPVTWNPTRCTIVKTYVGASEVAYGFS